MNKFRKRIFGAGILFLMMILAIGTMVSFAEERSSSYHLTIKKVFSDETKNDPVAWATAQKMTYNFRVEGQVKKGGANEYESVVKTVKLPDADGNWEVDIPFDNAFKISVIEQTDDSEEGEYDVTKTTCVSSMHVGASQATINISKDGGEINVTRPANVPDVTFRLTRESSDGGSTISYADVTVKAGETKELGAELPNGLPQGQYTITKLRSSDGFSVLVGSRDFTVPADGTGKVHINGNDSKLQIIAPAPEDGVVRTHHYRISGPVSRDIDVKSGKTGTVEHLTEGDYYISVYETYDGIKGYTVDFPVTTVKERDAKSTALSYTSDRSYKSFSVNNAKYVEFYGFGPLYDSSSTSGKVMSSVTYKMNYGVIDPETNLINRYNLGGPYAGSRTLKNPIKLVAADNKLYFAVTDVSSTAAKAIRVRWREYTETERNKEIDKPNEEGDVVEIDDRGWIKLSKKADSDPLGGQVTYYYTITDSNGVNVSNLAGFEVIDSNGNKIANPTDDGATTVMLTAGNSVTVRGLHEGNFHIKEMVKPVPSKEFMVRLDDTEKKATAPGETIDIEILDYRTVEISRPGDPTDDGGRVYTYNIYKVGEEEPFNKKPITLQSGGRTTVMEQVGKMLPPGKYHIRAMDDQIVGFDVAFSDSSSLVSDYIGEATVTFTNTVGKVEASYHVVHEYYLKIKNDDGSYTYKFEGASPVFSKNCDGTHPEGAGHTSAEIHKLDVHDGKTYTHIKDGGDAYGKVVSWVTGGTAKEVPLEDGIDIVYFGPYMNDWRGQNAEGTYEYAYKPLTNLDRATAVPHQEAEAEAAQIIILRYEREETPKEHGKYNVIHVYYQRTSTGDEWEGSRKLETVDVGLLTSENRYITYDADHNVELKTRFTPSGENVEYPYVYDGASYGRIVDSGNSSIPENMVGNGKEYRKDGSMTNVKATEEGDQIIILRYYRAGGYNVVHEYYYQEKANFAEDSGDSGEETGGTVEGETGSAGRSVMQAGENSVSGNDVGGTESPTEQMQALPEGADSDSGSVENMARKSENDVSGNNLPGSDSGGDAALAGENDVSGNNPPDSGGGSDESTESTGAVPDDVSDAEMELIAYSDEIQTRDGVDGGFNGTLTDSEGYTYTYEGNRDIVSYSADLESRHDAGKVKREKVFQPAGSEQYTYVYKDAVYGYVDKDTGVYRMAPYKTGVTATAKEDEIIILRYIRGDGVEEPEEPDPPETPDPPGGGGGGGGHDPDPTPPPVEEEIPEIPPEELPTELPDPSDPDSPDRITILEDGVPRTYVKVWDPDKLEWIYIPEEEVPLWGMVPQTGDESSPDFWLILASMLLCGMAVLKFTPEKKKDL